MIILRYMHVCNVAKINGTERLAKIYPMRNILVAAWQAAYYPYREICRDESMIAFIGETGATVYQLKKPQNGDAGMVSCRFKIRILIAT